MKKVLVSVIIAYNKDRGWLHEAVASVHNQIIPEWIEIELIKVYDPKGNASKNLNRGIQLAKGDFIKYLDEDDRLTPNSIHSSILAFNEDTDFIHGKAWTFYGSKKTAYIPRYKNPTLKELIKPDWFIHGGTLMYRAHVFNEIGLFDTSLTCGEELDLNLRCLASGMKIGWCDDFLYEYRRHDNQKSLGVNADQKSRDKIKAEIRNKYINLCHV